MVFAVWFDSIPRIKCNEWARNSTTTTSTTNAKEMNRKKNAKKNWQLLEFTLQINSDWVGYISENCSITVCSIIWNILCYSGETLCFVIFHLMDFSRLKHTTWCVVRLCVNACLLFVLKPIQSESNIAMHKCGVLCVEDMIGGWRIIRTSDW